MKKTMKLLLVGILPIFVFGGCSKHSKNITLNDSGIDFVYQPTEKTGVAATFAGEEVSDSQLLSQSPALEELLSIEDEVLIALLYQYTLNKYSADLAANKKVALTIYKPETPKKTLAQVLSHLGLQPHKGITVTYAKPQGDASLVGNINSTNVNTTDLNLTHFRFYGLKKKQFHEKLARLQGIVVRRALLKEATAEKQNIEEFINKNIGSSPATTDAEITAFMAKNNINEGDLNEGTKDKIKQIVEENKKNQKIEDYVSRKLVKEPVVIHFKPPQAVFAMNPGLATNWGYSSAPVNIVLFSDFQCAPCLQMGQNLIKIREEFKGQLKISFNHFFSENDRNARMLAEASMCVGQQKSEMFGKFYDEYISKNLGPDEPTIYDTVAKVGGNVDKFKECFLPRTFQIQVNDHIKYALSMGVTYQPTILVDDEILEGAVSAEDLTRAIQHKVDQKGDPWYKAMWRRLFGN